MKNRLRILFLSSEVAPFAKTGGLADVSSALPKALFDMGHDVRVMMPKYGSISDRKYILREVIRLKQIPVKVGDKEYVTSAKSAFIPDSKVQIYFLECPKLFDRKDLYVDSKTGKDFPDNAERFLVFSKAVFETIKLLHWEPQVIHCNDWPTALIPYLLKTQYGSDNFFSKTATMLSIHNLAYQGSFELDVAKKLGLAEGDVVEESIQIHGKLNFLKAGIVHSDLITTVSPTYAAEIQEFDEQGAGLKEVLQDRAQDIYGIMNGVDYTVWDPQTDKFLPEKYSAEEIEGKTKNKEELLLRVGLPYHESVPLIGIISRLADQKGFDLIAEAIGDIVKLNAQLVILGTGDPKYHTLIEKWQKKYPKNVAAILRFDEEMAHLIEAGSDLFLMPSKYEPSGLNQMYSLRYGTIPVVRKTGGLADTIIDYNEDNVKGNGFVFENYSSAEMIDALKRAIDLFADAKTWQKLIKRCMKMEFTWQAAAEKYVKLYSKLDNFKRRK